MPLKLTYKTLRKERLRKKKAKSRAAARTKRFGDTNLDFIDVFDPDGKPVIRDGKLVREK